MEVSRHIRWLEGEKTSKPRRKISMATELTPGQGGGAPTPWGSPGSAPAPWGDDLRPGGALGAGPGSSIMN